MKAIRSLEQHVDCLMSYDFTHLDDEELTRQLAVVDDRRIWVIAEALRRGFSYDKIHEITKIDKWFIDKLCILTEMETALKKQPLTAELLKEAKRIEFPDNVIARLTGKTEEEIKDMRYANGITAAYKMVDTCAAEFAAETPYYYSVFGSENEAIETNDRKKVLVLGSGPIRIGRQTVFRATDTGRRREHRKPRKTGRSRSAVRRTDRDQTDRSPDEDGRADPRNIRRKRRCSRRP